METNPTPDGELNELERRLGEWRPSTVGLNADQMLFAAGRDSVRPGRGRNAGLIASGCLALLATALATGFMHERQARIDLFTQLQNLRPAGLLNGTVTPESAEVFLAEAPAASSYFAGHAALAHDPDVWLEQRNGGTVVGSITGRPILKANSPVEMLER